MESGLGRDLANDPKFKMIGRKYLIAEAKSLRRVKAMFDAMVAEGTDISEASLNDMMDDMRGGKKTIKDKDSAADTLFGNDEMDMDMNMR